MTTIPFHFDFLDTTLVHFGSFTFLDGCQIIAYTSSELCLPNVFLYYACNETKENRESLKWII